MNLNVFAISMIVSTVLCSNSSGVVWADVATASESGGEYKLNRNQSVDFAKLSKSGNAQIVSTRKGYILFVDSSVIFNMTAKGFIQVATSYQNYIKWKMPMLKSVYIIDQKQQQEYLLWNWLSVLGIKSKHCVKSWIKKLPEPERSALLWRMAKCPEVSKIHDKTVRQYYAEKPAFKNMYGSFYIETLPPGRSGKSRIYVRYYTVTHLNDGIPAAIVHWISKLRLKSDIRKMFQIFETNAQL